MFPNMATSARAAGPTAERVATNVRTIRKQRGLDLAGLAERMSVLGQAISVTGLSKLENGDRRVHVEDLVALAVALDVSPNRLLLTAEADNEDIALVPAAGVKRGTAWRWAAGDAMLPLDIWDPPGSSLDLDRMERFVQENRPHDLPDETSLAELEAHAEALSGVALATQRALEDGLTVGAVIDYIELTNTIGQIVAGVRDRKEQSDGQR